MPTSYSITEYFGENLAIILANKILTVYPAFDKQSYTQEIKNESEGLSYTKRVELHAEKLKKFLPSDYLQALNILTSILGPENPKEDGMFTNFYWIMPIGKFVQLYGLNRFTESVKAIEEITKRNTGEYAIRPYIEKYPEKSLKVIQVWAKSKNFHLRRLASEGLRPKLPWAPKLDTFKNNPKPIFKILEMLKEDEVKFVKRSVANHIRDWVKICPDEANKILDKWAESDNKHTAWIVKHARR